MSSLMDSPVRVLVEWQTVSGVKGGPTRQSRREKAQATRLRIVEAALAAFLERGYSGTTMDAVATEAGVAVQTVYFVFHTKGELLQAVYEHLVLGPERVPPHLTWWWRAVEEEPEVVPAVRTLVSGSMDLLVRAAPLVWIVLGDETAREGYEFNEGMRRDGYEVLVRTLTSKHPLRPDVTSERARDLLLLLTGPQLYAQLARDLKWSRDEIEEWMITSVLQQLFGIG
jgi:AcrR family transcriptional regulator